MQQMVMGPIRLKRDPVYGFAVAASNGISNTLPKSIEIDASMVSRATDTSDNEIDMYSSNNANVGPLNGNVSGAEFGAVGYMGAYEVNDRKRKFGPWFLAQAELGDISVTQGAAGTSDHGKVLIEVEESIANKSIVKGGTFVDTNPMDVDDDDMFEVKMRVRYFVDGQARSAGWGAEEKLEAPKHPAPARAAEDETTVYTKAGLIFASNGTSVGNKTLLANTRIELEFQQYAKVASATDTIAKEEGGGSGTDDKSVYSTGTIPIGNPKMISVVYTRMKDLITADKWVVDKKRETNPDMLNSNTATNGTDQHDFIRIEPNDLQSLASNPFAKPHSSLVNANVPLGGGVEDHELSEWAEKAYSNFNVKLVVEASIAATRNNSGAVQKEKLVTLGEVRDIRLVPKVARDVQAMAAIDRWVVRSAAIRQQIGSGALYRAVEYNNAVGAVSGDRVDNSWLLVDKNNNTLWRQAMFEGLFAKMEAALAAARAEVPAAASETDLTIVSTRLRIQLVGSGPSYSGSDDIRMLINTQADDNILKDSSQSGQMPQLKNKLDPLQGFSQLRGPTIIDSSTTADMSNKRLEIPITLSSDGLEQVNIMIAHSTDDEAYFNDLRADGKYVRNFKKRMAASGNAAAYINSSAAGGGVVADTNKDSIQLAASPEKVSEANMAGNPSNAVPQADLVTDTVSGTVTAKDLFFFQKINSDGQRETANVDFQVVGGSSASEYSKNLSGQYILHAAIPAEGDNQFLLLNVVTNGGNRKFVAYKKGEDGKTFERVK
jgi:hypothetical protein